MSSTYMPAFESPASIVPSSSSSSDSENANTSALPTIRERRGFAPFAIAFAPPLPKIAPKGNLGPTHANLPRRKRSSAVSIDMPVPAPAPVPADAGRTAYFA